MSLFNSEKTSSEKEEKEEVKKEVKKETSSPHRHERFRVNRLASPDQPIRVRIVGPTEVFASEDVEYLQVNISDGKMCVNKRYASVIEKLKEGEIKLKLAYPENSKQEKRYYISSGWMITSHNLCELVVKSCKETSSI